MGFEWVVEYTEDWHCMCLSWTVDCTADWYWICSGHYMDDYYWIYSEL